MTVDVITEIVIDRPVDQVAEYAADPTNAPEWYANIDSVEWNTEPPVAQGSSVAFVARFLGRRLEYTYELVELEPGQRLVMRTQQGPFPMETTYTWQATEEGSTRMTLRKSRRTERLLQGRGRRHDARHAPGQPQGPRQHQAHPRSALTNVDPPGRPARTSTSVICPAIHFRPC
jgi:uncharacterized protein YndB with AHSA1/START domain